MAALNPLLLGIEIGGTKLQLGLGRGDGAILALERRKIRPEDGASGILRQIEEAYSSLLAAPAISGETPQAVGIGFGGPVDADRGLTLKSHQIEGWDDFDLEGWASETLKISRVAIRNDADTAGLGEALHGAGVGLSPVFYVTIGSGIGGGLILDGQIYRGSGRGAAEIGHLWMDDIEEGPRKLEEIASGWSIGRSARELLARGEALGLLASMAQGDPLKIDASTVASAASGGDPQAIAILARAAQAVGQALAHVVTLLAPRRIILGGGVSMIEEEFWIKPIRKTLDARVFPPFLGSFDIISAALGEEVVIHGALAMARNLTLKLSTGLPKELS
jgi:glucokinase